MKVQETFVIDQPRDRVWGFFESIPDVARCVPGVQSVEVVDDDRSNVRVRQSLGPMSATFDLAMRITSRVPSDRIEFSAIGRAVKGAAGNLRSVNIVTLSAEGEGTKVSLESDVGLGGMLGSVGQKVVSRQASSITHEFAEALERALNGEEPRPAGEEGPAPAIPGPPATGGVRRPPAPPPSGRWPSDPRVSGLAGLSLGLAVAVVVAVILGWRRS